MDKKKNALLYMLLTVFSVVFLFFGNRIATKNAIMFTGQAGGSTETYVAHVDLILDHTETKTKISDTFSTTETKIKFTATILFGARRGDTLAVYQTYDDLTNRIPTPVREGDWVLVHLTPETSDSYYAGELVRIQVIVVAAAIFFVLLIIFARLKGIATVAALLLSVMSIFLVFIPSILSGYNVYGSAVLICAYTILITPFFIGGFNRKSVASAIGCVGGVALAGLLAAFLNNYMRITGAVDDETMAVAFILKEGSIDLRAIVFAAVLIGALGACLDVSMSISSAIYEMKALSEKKYFGDLFKSGLNLGWDIMGTQISTLVLAYIGGSLSIVLLLVAYQPSVLEMLNREAVIIELLQMLVGCFTILFTIPATAFVSAAMFSGGTGRRRKRH
ncbi:MAG: YibE/F family protein [Oscillospiraceae bacterium]|nr:YibE/F family protein [Oscillospiraceae bacterium]